MRVLYVNQTAQMSGAERSLMTLLSSLKGRLDPVVACPDGELAEAVRGEGIETAPIVGTGASFRLHPVHTGRGLAEMARSSLQVRRLVAGLEPDLVHANTTRAALLALLARRRSGPPTVAHIRDWVPEGRLSRFVLGTIGRRADAVVANSAYVARQFAGMPLRRPVQVIHNPVDLTRFDPERADGGAVRRELDIAPDAVVLSVVAQLTPWKGQDDAILALAGLSATDRDVVLLVVGSAKFDAAGTQFDNRSYERDLHALVASRGLEDRVLFLGERSDVADVLAATDVLLMPSWREAFGRIAIEAMAMGTAVAATEVGGPAEIVTPGVEGLLVPPRDADAWSRALRPLIDDRGIGIAMGERGRRRAADFSAEAHASAVLSLYASLAG